ncbi:MAG: acyltransferase [Rhodocyclaceae bacterium]|nr:acyltransferase [Rhodocyclaceae bacterium]
MARKRLEGVEAARGVAAMLVVFFHAAHHLKSNFGVLPLWGIAQFGHAGVDFFFVLSGFIIAFVHHGDIGQPNRLRHYLVRRFSRVFPFFWIVFLASLGLLAVSAHRSLPPVSAIVSNFFLLPQTSERVVGVSWSLVMEMYFYAFFAITIVSRRIGIALFSVWLLVALAAMLGWGGPPGAYLAVFGSSFGIEFFFGMGAAYLLVHRSVPMPRGMLAAGVGAFLATAAVELLGGLDGFGVLARVWYGLASMLLVLGLVESERQGLITVPKALFISGRASYSIYLVHVILVGLIYKVMSFLGVLRLLPLWSSYLLLSFGAIIGGVVLSVWVEYPSIRFFRNLLESRTERRA